MMRKAGRLMYSEERGGHTLFGNRLAIKQKDQGQM